MTTIYEAPLRDIKFVLEELIGVEPVSYTHLTLPTNREV